MFNVGNHKKVVDELCLAIRRAPENKSRSRRMSYKAVPYDNQLVYNGVALSEVMVPQIIEPHIVCQAAFDLLIDNSLHGIYAPLDGVNDHLSANVIDWLGKWSDPTDKAVMLLWAIGQSHGVSIDYDDASIIVTTDVGRFGISNREVMSRFNTGAKFSIRSPRKLLCDGNLVRTFSSKTIAMYREAYRIGENETNALLAILTAYPDFNLWDRIKRTPSNNIPSITSLRRWERIITTTPDPVAGMYRVLFPSWLSKGQFRGVFGSVTSRNREPGPLARQRMITALYHHFYKNKELSK